MRKAIAITLAVMAAVAVAEVRFWLPRNENLRESAASPLHRTTSQVAMARAGESWTNPYVTDGLIAMWDGEWNAGPGVHDPNATSLQDIQGSLNSLEYNHLVHSVFDKYVYAELSQGDIFGRTTSYYDEITTATLEVVYKKNDYGNQDFEIGYAILRHDVNTYNNFVWSPMGSTYGSQSTRGLSSISCSCLDGVANQRMYENGSVLTNPNSRNGVKQSWVGACATWKPNKLWFYTMRIYNRALTAAEIAHNYAVDKARFNLP